MKTYARIADGRVAEPPIELPDDLSPSDAFHADVAAHLVTCPAGVREGWLYDGEAFAAPAPQSVSTPPARTASGPTLIKALSDAQFAAIKPRDQACIAGRDSLAENLDMIVRAAGKAGIIPKAWFDLALGVTASTP